MSALEPIKLHIGEESITTTRFQLLQWKHALRLEEKGMTLSRGRKVSTHLRCMLGLKRSYSIKQISKVVEERLDEL